MNIDTSEIPIPRDEYPATITILDMVTRAELWTLTIPAPAVIDIPPVEELNGGRLTIVQIKGASGHGAQFPPENIVRRLTR